MRIKTRKWRNNLVLRIPGPFAAALELREGAEVDLTIEGERLVVTPLGKSEYTLNELLSRVTPENMHHGTGPWLPVGGEVW